VSVADRLVTRQRWGAAPPRERHSIPGPLRGNTGHYEGPHMGTLPGWYEDWGLFESEDWRQLRLHALEALADRLTAAGRFAEAALAAHGLIRADPLRETA
jgi:hypothetical protein